MKKIYVNSFKYHSRIKNKYFIAVLFVTSTLHWKIDPNPKEMCSARTQNWPLRLKIIHGWFFFLCFATLLGIYVAIVFLSHQNHVLQARIQDFKKGEVIQRSVLASFFLSIFPEEWSLYLMTSKKKGFPFGEIPTVYI